MIGELINLWRRVPDQLAALFEQWNATQLALGELAHSIRRPQPAFVALLALAETIGHEQESQRTSAGCSTQLSRENPRAWLSVMNQAPIRNLQLIVLCDLSRVHVESLLVGLNGLTMTIGDVPVGFYAHTVRVGQQYGAHVRLRDA